jgi:hypothetical protein
MANLLQKSSIIITPTSYDVGSINAIKPIQTFGDELITNGDFATDSDWTKATGTTISGGKLNITDNSTNDRTFQNIGMVQNKVYRLVFEVSNYQKGNLGILFGGSTTPNIPSVTSDGTYTFNQRNNGSNSFFYFVGNLFEGSIDNVSVKEVVDADLDFERSTTATRIQGNGFIGEQAIDVPRLDFLGPNHWLIEPEATNTATYSNDFTQGDIFLSSSNPAAANSTLTLNQITSPDGTTNAMKLTCDTSDTIHHIRFENVAIISDNTNIISLFVKKGSGVDWFAIASQDYDAPDKRAWFNVSTGVLGSATNVAGSNIEDYGNGWYRCSMAFKTATDVSGKVRLIVTNANESTTFVGDGEFHYYYGLQCETSDNDFSTKPTSYIPTNGSQITRARDTFGLNTTLNTSLINSTEGTFYIEMAALENDRTDRAISISDDSTTNTLWIRFRSDSLVQMKLITDLGSTTAINSSSLTTTNFLKIGARFKTNDIALYVNGTQVGTNTSNPTFSANTLNTIKSTRGDGSDSFEGKLKCIAVFKEGLTDSELTCLTS